MDLPLVATANAAADREMVGKKQQRLALTLKNGAIADARHALMVVDALRAMQRVHPERFGLLVAVAQGRDEAIEVDQLKLLKKETYFFDPRGNLRKDVADVLVSALEQRDNSYVLIQPFRLATEHDKQLAEQAQQQNDQALINTVFGRGRDGLSRR